MIGADDPELGAAVADLHERETRKQRGPVAAVLSSLVIVIILSATVAAAAIVIWLGLVVIVHHLWFLTVDAWHL